MAIAGCAKDTPVKHQPQDQSIRRTFSDATALEDVARNKDETRAQADVDQLAGGGEDGDEKIPVEKAIEIARRAVKANDTWSDRATYEASRDGDGWSVMVWRITGHDSEGNPQFTPGGHRLILIDKQGKVTRYMRGS